MPFLDLPDVRIFFTDTGAAHDSTLVLLHGWACDSHDWSWQLPSFDAWARVVAMDLRGHGRSSPASTGYGLAEYSSDVAGVLDALDLSKPVLVGHSFGGVIATAVAGSRPEDVRGLVVVDPAYGFGPEVAATAPATVEALRTDSSHQVVEALIAQPDARSTDPGLTTWRKRRAVGMSTDVLAETMAGHLAGSSGFAYRTQAESLLRARTHPVLAFYCDAERANWERSLSTHPGSRQHLLAGTGHWLHQENPDKFNYEVRNWVLELS